MTVLFQKTYTPLPIYIQPYSRPVPGALYSTVKDTSLPISFFLKYSLDSQANGCNTMTKYMSSTHTQKQ